VRAVMKAITAAVIAILKVMALRGVLGLGSLR